VRLRLEDRLPQNLRGKLVKIKGKAEPLLAKIKEVFPEYTIHDIHHSNKVIEILDWFVPDQMKSAMKEWEVFFLLCAAVFHDCGMAKLLGLEDTGESEIREKHHIRSEKYVVDHWENLGFDDKHQAEIIGRLCRGHRETPDNTEDYNPRRKYERVHGEDKSINMPLLVMLLQIADALDLTFERAPWEYYEKICPKLERISMDEWQRQMFTSGASPAFDVRRIEVDVSGCHDLRILEAVDQYIYDIQTQLDLLPDYLHNYRDYAEYLFQRIVRIPLPEKRHWEIEILKEAPWTKIKSLGDFYKLTTDTRGFIERLFKDEEEWRIKKEQLYYFGEHAEIEQEFQTISAKLERTNICLITGEPNSGKSTSLLFFIDECLKRNIDTLILFLNPFIEAEILAGDNGILNEIDRFITTQYRGYEKRKVLLAIDALRREESIENYIEKCDKLFEWVFSRGYRLIATLRSDQRDLLKKNLENMPINKWIKYNLKEGEIEAKPFNLEQTKKAVIRYLNFSPYEKIKPPELSLDSKEFNECVEIIARKSRRVIGDIAFIIEDIYISSQEFSKETLEKYPEGTVGIPSGYVLRWNTIRRDYYLVGDKVLPAMVLFLTYQNYSITRQFVDKFVEWGVDELDEGLLDRKQISSRVENLLKFYCISTTFENVEQFRLRSDWREAIEQGSLIQRLRDNSNLPVSKFVEIVNSGNLVNWIVRFIFKLQNDLESGGLSYCDIETWHIVGDMAKAWGIDIKGLEIKTKLEILESATNFLTNTLRSHPEIWHIRIPWDFLKKTFSLILGRSLNDATPQYCDVAIAFYKELNRRNPEDFFSSWMLGEFLERKGQYDEALELYVESASTQNTSKGYGSLIDKLRSRKDILPDYVQFECLGLREKAAMKAIECYAGNHRNWSDLAEALTYKGDIFVKQEKFGKAIKNYDNAIKAYEKGIEVIEKLTPRLFKEDKRRYQIRIAVILGKRADANACIGRLEESIKDTKRALEIKSSVMDIEEEIEESRISLHKYDKLLVTRDFIIPILDQILYISDLTIKREEREKLSKGWYKVKELLSNLDPELVGISIDYFNDLKISSLYQAINLDENNWAAKQDLRELTDISLDKIREEKKYTAKYHENCAELLKDKKHILEVFHRLFSASIHSWIFVQHLRAGNVKRGQEGGNKWVLSGRWGIAGKRIVEDFIAKIPHRIAVKCFEFSVFFNPDNSDSWHNLGWEYFHDGKLGQARDAFEKNLKIEEERNKIRNSHLSKIGIGKIYQERKDAITAANWFKEGAELCIEFYAKDDPQKTVDQLIKTNESLKDLVVLTIPEDKKIEIMKDALGLSDRALKISESAQLTDFQRLLQDGIKWLEREIRWVKGKKMLPAMSLDEILDTSLVTLLSIESEPERVETLYDKQFAFSRLGEHEKSAEYADKILELEPNNIFAWINKGTSLAKLEKYEEALKCVEKVTDSLDPSNAFAWHNKGVYLEKLGRWEEAKKCYKESSRLGYILAEFKFLRLTKKIKKPNTWLYKIYGSLHANLQNGFKKGIFTEAKKIAETALSEVDNKEKLIKEISKLTLSWFKNIVFKYDFLDSREKLLFLLDEFKVAFEEFNVKVPSLEEIKEKCMQSEKYEESKEKIKKIFG